MRPLTTAACVLALAAAAAGDPLYEFDFDGGQGTQAGWTGVTTGTIYGQGTPASPYGWLSSPESRDRGPVGGNPLSNLLGDFHNHSADRTFCVDLDPGAYQLTFYFHDNTTAQNHIQVRAEGSGDLLLEIGSLPANTTVIETRAVAVTDGTLELLFHAGGTSHWICNGIEVIPEPACLSLLAAAGAGLLVRRRRGR